MKFFNERVFLIIGLMSLLGWAALISSPSTLLAHGVSWDLSEKKAYGFEFNFDDGSPMAFSEVKVYRPGEDESLSQTGRTDKNGYFAFIPDADGKWLVKADDGTGHLVQAEVTVATQAAGDGGAAQAPAAVGNPDKLISQATKPFKIALVVSVFLNLAVIASLVRRKKA